MKHIFKVTRYLLGVILFFGCQQDDAVISENHTTPTLQKTTKVVSLDQIFGLETVVRKAETLRRQGQNPSFPQSKNTSYLSTLDIDNIISISDANGNQSYTIDIVNTESGINFEKLRLVKYMDGYIASIQRFEPTQTWYDSESNMNHFTGQIQNMSLDRTILWFASLDNGVVISSTNGIAKNSVPCIVNIYWEDSDGQQYEEDPVDGDNYASAGITMVVEVICDTDTSGSGSSSSSTSNSTGTNGSADGTFLGGNNGGSNNNNNPTEGSDVSCTDCDTGTSFDLKNARTKSRLLRMSNDPKIKAMLLDLKNKAEDINHTKEGGAAYRKKSDGTYEERLPSVIQGTVTGFSPSYVSGESLFVHMHPKKALDHNEVPPELKEVAPIPSKADLINFLELMYERDNDSNEPSSSDDDDEIVAMLVTDIGTFALTIGNKANVLAADTAINSANSDDAIIRQFIETYNKNIKKNCDDDACRIREFINFIKTFTINGNTLGIDMYQAIFTTDGIADWRKL